MLFLRLDHSQYWDAVLGVACCVFLLLLRVSQSLKKNNIGVWPQYGIFFFYSE